MKNAHEYSPDFVALYKVVERKAPQFLHDRFGFDFEKPFHVFVIPAGSFTVNSIKKTVAALECIPSYCCYKAVVFMRQQYGYGTIKTENVMVCSLSDRDDRFTLPNIPYYYGNLLDFISKKQFNEMRVNNRYPVYVAVQAVAYMCPVKKEQRFTVNPYLGYAHIAKKYAPQQFDKSGCNVWEGLIKRIQEAQRLKVERKAAAAAAEDITKWIMDTSAAIEECRRIAAEYILTFRGNDHDYKWHNPAEQFLKVCAWFAEFTKWHTAKRFSSPEHMHNSMNNITEGIADIRKMISDHTAA